jgi:hypothetical protein
MRVLELMGFGALGLLPALAIGFGLASAGDGSGPDPTGSASETGRPVEPPGPGAVEPFGGCADIQARVERLDASATLLRGQIRALRAQEIDLIGEPATWPEAPPEGLGPDDAQELAEQLRGAGYLVYEVECSEPPCILTLVRAVDQPLPWEAFPERFRFDVASPVWLESTDLGDGSAHVIEMGSRRFSGGTKARLDWRVDLASDALLEAAEAGQLALPEGG